MYIQQSQHVFCIEALHAPSASNTFFFWNLCMASGVSAWQCFALPIRMLPCNNNRLDAEQFKATDSSNCQLLALQGDRSDELLEKYRAIITRLRILLFFFDLGCHWMFFRLRNALDCMNVAILSACAVWVCLQARHPVLHPFFGGESWFKFASRI